MWFIMELESLPRDKRFISRPLFGFLGLQLEAPLVPSLFHNLVADEDLCWAR